MKSILFDLDGTIINSTDAIVGAFALSCKQERVEGIKSTQIKSLIGYPLWDMFQMLGVPKNKINNCIEHYKTNYSKTSHQQTTLIKNAKEALILAKSFAKTCAVTTKMSKGSISILTHLNVWQYFDDVVGFDNVSNPKPHKEPILLAINKLNANKDKTWMIGDTTLDMESAKSAGIQRIGILTGYQDEDALKKWTNIIKNDSLKAVEYIKDMS